MQSECVLFWIALHVLLSQNSHSQLTNKSASGMLILHAEALSISAQREDCAKVLGDVCIHNNDILEVFTSRSTANSSNSINNTITTISIKLICFNKQTDLFIQHLLEIIRGEETRR